MGVALPGLQAGLLNQSNAQMVDGSLKFDSGSSNYLNRTPSATGNRKTWTWSGWVKKNGMGTQSFIFCCMPSGSYFQSYFSADKLYLQSNSPTFYVETTRVFRDLGWYHIVIVLDTPQAIATNRLKLYVNGEEEASFSTDQRSSLTQNSDLRINDTQSHSIGSQQPLQGVYADFNLSQVTFIDGLTLGSGYFGFTDPLTNTWRPKKFRAEGTTVNDGRVFSSTGTFSNWDDDGSYPKTELFDGTLYTGGTPNGATSDTTGEATFDFGDQQITGFQNLQINIFLSSNQASATNVVSVNGVDITQECHAAGNNTWTTVDLGSKFTTLKSFSIANYYIYVGGFIVDGVTMIDSTTTNLAFGTNGFYLPMDGNSPIGEDKSGNGNDFTPVNFGGSVALPKATGAKPILNTDGGGRTARVGVFGSEVGAQYTTTSATNSGGKYVFENEGTQPTFSFIRGATYTFDYNASTGHPLRFATAADAAGSTQYTDGTNTSVSNVISFTVPHNAPNTLHYYCTNHSGMGNSISVTTDETKADPYAWKNVLALPLIDNGAGGTTQDFSNQINAGSTTKASTTTGSTDSTSAQSVFYNRSFVLDGNGDDIRVPDDADFTFGSGDFTLECWAYQTANSSWRSLMMKYDSTESNASWYWALNTGVNNFYFYYSGANSKLMQKTSNTAILLNTWVHFAITRSGNVFRMFENGIQVGTMTESVTNNDGTIRFTVGADGNQNYDFAGYFSDVRVYKGVAKYTSNFIPASTNPDILPDTPSGVSGGSKLAKVTDGAVAFDGSGDSLASSDSADLAFGTGEFTVEMFFYANTVSGNDVLYDSRAATGNPTDGFSIVRNSNQLRTYTSGAYKITPSTFRVVSYRWYHLAITRESTTQKMYIDGELVGSATVSNDFSQNKATIGSDVGTGESWDGFISNVRLIKGTALYTSNFTPPTAPLTNVTNTKLLCCQSNTSATAGAVIPNDSAELNAPLSSVAFADSSTRSKTITNVGSITTASAGSNTFNITNAASFDGSSKRLNLPQTGMTFTGSFTLDTYIKLDSSASNYNAIINTGYQTGSDQYVYIGVDNNDRLYLEDPTASRTTASGAISKNTWYHVRVTQGDGNMKLYANGTLQVTHATNTVNMVTGRNFTIGSLLATGNNSNNFHGLIGPTRYVATNLGAPSAGGEATTGGALSNLSFTGSITANGNAAANTFNPFITDIHTVRGQETGYATFSPLLNLNNTLSDGNLLATGGSGSWESTLCTGVMESGKWFVELTHRGRTSGSDNDVQFGLFGLNNPENGYPLASGADLAAQSTAYVIVDAQANWYNNGSSTSYGTTWSTPGDVVGLRYNADTGKLGFIINGVDRGDIGATLSTSQRWVVGISFRGTSSKAEINFGQKPFKFPPPDGFQPLNAANARPETVIVRPDQYVGATTYTGTTGAGTIKDDNIKFTPDFVWLKSRSNAEGHALYDTVRGSTGGNFYRLRSDTTAAQNSPTNELSSMIMGGFTVNNNGHCYYDGYTYVAWCWKAGGNKNTFNVDDVGYASAAAAGITEGTISLTGASIGTKQGFSILSYSGSGSNGTFGHGLLETPEFVIVKCRNVTQNWAVQHSAYGPTKYTYLNQNYGARTTGASAFWNDTAPTNSVVHVGTDNDTNASASGRTYIAYCWHNVPGLQKFGSYSSNNSTNGPFIELGFRPALIMVKESGADGQSWNICDTSRNSSNPANKVIAWNAASSEYSYTTFDILSNGFKIRTNDNGWNGSSSTFIYAAWAEAPTFNLYGGQSNAR